MSESVELILDVVEYEPLPPGDYHCVIDRIESIESEFGGEVKEQFQWTFSIQSGPFAGREIRGWTSRNNSSKSKLYAWYCAVLHLPLLPVQKQTNLNLLYGKPVVVGIDQYVNQAGVVRNKIVRLQGVGEPVAAASPAIDPFE